MSQFSLPQNGLFSISSIPFMCETLQLIETRKNLPQNNLSFFQKNIRQSCVSLECQENSLQISLNNHQKSMAQHTQAGITPKKKRVGCICKKTKCLKMYCECFSSGKLCTPECVCYGCNNHQDCSSIIQKAKQTIKNKNTNELLKQSKGCNCKKSQCQKKYCECFNAGISCGVACKCEDCANNDGSCQHSKQEKEPEDIE